MHLHRLKGSPGRQPSAISNKARIVSGVAPLPTCKTASGTAFRMASSNSVKVSAQVRSMPIRMAGSSGSL